MASTASDQEVAVAIVERSGCFLVRQRAANVTLAGKWEFPGGKVESRETPQVAAMRETWEEAGLQVEAIETLETRQHVYPHGRLTLHFFRCRLVVPSAEPTEGWIWLRRQDLAKLDFPAANAAVVARLSRERDGDTTFSSPAADKTDASDENSQ